MPEFYLKGVFRASMKTLCFDLNAKCPQQAHVLGTLVSPASSTVSEGCGVRRRWNLDIGSGLVGQALRFCSMALLPVHFLLPDYEPNVTNSLTFLLPCFPDTFRTVSPKTVSPLSFCLADVRPQQREV